MQNAALDGILFFAAKMHTPSGRPACFLRDWQQKRPERTYSYLDRIRIERLTEENFHGSMIDYGAFDGKQLVGYVTIGTERNGSEIRDEKTAY